MLEVELGAKLNYSDKTLVPKPQIAHSTKYPVNHNDNQKEILDFP